MLLSVEKIVWQQTQKALHPIQSVFLAIRWYFVLPKVKSSISQLLLALWLLLQLEPKEQHLEKEWIFVVTRDSMKV